MAQEGTLQKSSKFYRSIQYRSASLDIKHQKLNINTDKLPAFQLKKPTTSKHQQRKSKKSLFRSEQNLSHFAKSLSQSLSKIKQSDLNTTLISYANPETQKIHNFGTCSYLQSFAELMESQEKHTYRRKKLGALSIKLDSLKVASKIDRIELPNIIEYDNSQFTALDPIRLPINGIKEHIQKTRKNMEECPNQLKSIRCEIRDFQDKTVKKLEEFGSQFQSGVKKLWAKLRENSVQQQDFTMRIKRELFELDSFLPNFKRQFQATQNNQLTIQKVIFETTPFELKMNQSQNQNLKNEESQEKSTLHQSYF